MISFNSQIRQKAARYFWFAYIASLIFWGLAYFAQLVRFFTTNHLFAFEANNTLLVNDFVLWYNASLLAQRCLVQPTNIYDPVLQQAGVVELIRPFKTNILWYLQYPPQFFALVLPLSKLTMPAAYVLWCSSSLVLILWSMRCMVKELVEDKFAQLFIIIGTLSSHASWFAFENGQTTLFHFPALIWFWLSMRKQKYFVAGLISAVFLIKLQFLPFIVPIGLILGRLKYLQGLLITSSIVGVYTVMVTGWSNIINYPKALEFVETQSAGVASQVMQNFRGEFLTFLQPGRFVNSATIALYALCIGLSIVLWLWLLPRMQKQSGKSLEAFDLCTAISVIIMLISSPHTHFQDYMAIAIVASFLYSRIKPGSGRTINLTLARVLLIIFPFYSWVVIFLFVLIVKIHVQPYFLWACILLAAITIELKKQLPIKNSVTLKTE